MKNSLIRQLGEKGSKLCRSDDTGIGKELEFLNIMDQPRGKNL